MPKLDFELSRARGSGASENGLSVNKMFQKPPQKKICRKWNYIYFVCSLEGHPNVILATKNPPMKILVYKMDFWLKNDSIRKQYLITFYTNCVYICRQRL